MTAKHAAQALLQHDVEVYQFAQSLRAGYVPTAKKREQVLTFIEGYLMGTWTLTLAAASANSTEEQVIATLLHQEPFQLGTMPACRAEARRLFS